jgi:hypothetical protein
MPVTFGYSNSLPANKKSKTISGYLNMPVPLLAAIAQKHAGINTSNPLAAVQVADSSVSFSAAEGLTASAGKAAIAFGDNAIDIGRKTLVSTSGSAAGDGTRRLRLYSNAIGYVATNKCNRRQIK